MKLWINGNIEEHGAINPMDRGFTLGDGIFDTMLSIDGQIQDVGRHATRFASHAQVLNIPIPRAEELPGAIDALLFQNNLKSGRAAIRVTLTRGAGPRGLTPPATPQPTLIVQAFPAPDVGALAPINAITSKVVRRNEGSPLSFIKSLNYGDNIIAIQEAQAHGANEAIMLNNKAHAACASVANIFVRMGRKILTPPLKDGVLDGVMRAKLIEDGFAVEESITQDMLSKCDALFLSNSLTGLRAAHSLDGRALDMNIIRP